MIISYIVVTFCSMNVQKLQRVVLILNFKMVQLFFLLDNFFQFIYFIDEKNSDQMFTELRLD